MMTAAYYVCLLELTPEVFYGARLPVCECSVRTLENCWINFSLLQKDINLVDPASSHTLVSKIKPCMSKYKYLCTVKLRMAHYISYSLLDSTLLLG